MSSSLKYCLKYDIEGHHCLYKEYCDSLEEAVDRAAFLIENEKIVDDEVKVEMVVVYDS